jgi:heat shock protein HslJ
MMACPDGADLERNYLQALGRVTAFRMEGDTLSLLAGSEVLATFRAS